MPRLRPDTLWLERLGDGPAPATADAAETAAQLLLNGAIIAVKGIGGFHDRGRSGTPG
jgi:hydrogenase maturation factor HypF (carbamoyltransferase family)